MRMTLINVIVFILAFVLIWTGSGLIVNSMTRFSKRLRLSSFALSFIVLGLLTSTPEFAVGLQSIAENNPEIFVGNLLGGITLIFLFIIPLLAIFGNGINLKHELDNKTLLVTLAVLMAPVYTVLDKKVTYPEGVLLIFAYLFLLLLIEKRHGIFDKNNKKLFDIKAYSYKDVMKVVIGIGLVFLTSNIIVDKTIYFATMLNISTFYISLIAVSIGTNLPELSLAVRSVVTGKKDIAMGDYMGSASANTFLFGLFTLLNGGEVLTVNSFMILYVFTAIALILFYAFSSIKKRISRNDGIILLSIYVVFVVVELLM